MHLGLHSQRLMHLRKDSGSQTVMPTHLHLRKPTPKQKRLHLEIGKHWVMQTPKLTHLH